MAHSPSANFGRGPGPSKLGYAALALFSLLLLSPAFVAPFAIADELMERVRVLGYSLLLWVWWLALWGRAPRACVLAAPVLLVVPIDLYLLVAYRTLLSPSLFGVILESDFNEATQFLRGLWLPAAAAYACLLAVAILALRIIQRQKAVWRHRSRAWVLIGIPALLGGLHLLYHQQEAWAKDLKPAENPFRVEPYPLVLENLRDTFPFGLVLQLADYLEGSRKLAKVNESLSGFRFGATQASHHDGRQAFILVIGESARVDRWSINGYPRPTSPRLVSERNLLSLTNAVSVAPMTRLSVPIILTRKPAEQVLQLAFPERSLVSAFKEAGFTTYWMSTQSPLGVHDTSFSRYARESDHLAYFNPTGSWEETPHDGVMLEDLKSALANAEQRQFIVIHTLGSHFDYVYRYPDQFDVFKPSPTRGEPASLHDASMKTKLNNAYDNSIVYTDYFLGEVIAALKASGRPLAAMLYVSDHGEDLYDQGCENSGHGRSTRASYRIPFFFWYSDEYAKTFPNKVSTLKAHRTEPITTEVVFPTLLDAADIHFAGENLTRSASSASFQRQRRIVTNFRGNLDYDRAHLNDKCELVN